MSSSVVVDSSSAGWSGQVFVSDGAGTSLSDWGQPVATVTGADAGPTTIDLGGATGSHVLVWITDLGAEGGFRFDLQELTVLAG